jgi:hypothetical protein
MRHGAMLLVRLPRVRADALRDLITGAHRFVSSGVGKKPVIER